jgi:hypothetical protein
MKSESSDLKGKTVPQLLAEARQHMHEARKQILAEIEVCLTAIIEAKGTPHEKEAEAMLRVSMGWLEVIHPDLVTRYRAREAQLGRSLSPDEFRELRQAS